ncbi:MAG: hypothetical protein FWH40_07600 [Coriobacteriia bacterium]|nr:hypothetical protein [Coriobacteriia bacterium]
MSSTLYVDETMVDIANDMYAIHSELEDAKTKFEKAISLLNEHYVNEQAQTQFADLYELYSDRLGSLSTIYSKLSDNVWFVLSTMLEADNELANKVYNRMVESFLPTD